MIKRFLIIFIYTALFVIAISFSIYYINFQFKVEAIRNDNANMVHNAADVITDQYKYAIADLRILSDSLVMQSYLRDNGNSQRLLEDEFLLFSKNSGKYDQIRYIDNDGMEIIRVNFNKGNPNVVPENILQNKKDRYYFYKTFEMNEGDVFISPIDLNIENGEIEEPLKPTIRFGTPVFDDDGNKRGIIVLNFLAEDLGFSNTMLDVIGDAMLLNSDGYWLVSPNPEDEWGFMYADKSEHTFESSFPKVWDVIKNSLDGIIDNEDGLFIYNTMFPKDSLVNNAIDQTASPQDYAPLKIVIHTTEKQIESQTILNKRNIIIVDLGLLLFASLIAIRIANYQVQQKKADEDIKRLSAAVENSPVSVLITDTNADIIYTNRKFTEVSGYSSSEAIGMNPRAFKSGKHDQTLYKDLWGTILSGKEWFGELSNKRKNGEIYWESCAIAPIFDKKGKVVNFIAIKEDITERKRMEEQLQNAKTEAEMANKVKSEFLANMSHELRTPLNAINGFSEVLLESYFGDLNPKQTEYVHDILESGNHLLALINDILDLSKVEAGKEKLELSMVEISNLLENSIVMIKEKALKHNIELEIKIPENLKHFKKEIDQRKIKQVMFNLLSNAAKFTPDGGKITIEVIKLKNHLQISVIDTGIGIEEDDKQKIFDEFYQVRSVQDGKPRGTGLGLSLSKRYIEMHGGNIWVESDGVGKGSCFRFTLPINQNQQKGQG